MSNNSGHRAVAAPTVVASLPARPRKRAAPRLHAAAAAAADNDSDDDDNGVVVAAAAAAAPQVPRGGAPPKRAKAPPMLAYLAPSKIRPRHVLLRRYVLDAPYRPRKRPRRQSVVAAAANSSDDDDDDGRAPALRLDAGARVFALPLAAAAAVLGRFDACSNDGVSPKLLMKSAPVAERASMPLSARRRRRHSAGSAAAVDGDSDGNSDSSNSDSGNSDSGGGDDDDNDNSGRVYLRLQRWMQRRLAGAPGYAHLAGTPLPAGRSIARVRPAKQQRLLPQQQQQQQQNGANFNNGSGGAPLAAPAAGPQSAESVAAARPRVTLLPVALLPGLLERRPAKARRRLPTRAAIEPVVAALAAAAANSNNDSNNAAAADAAELRAHLEYALRCAAAKAS